MSRPTVHLLDYVAGNIRSLVNAIEKCGYEVEWIKSPEDVKNAEKIILPGVGHFGHCLSSLESSGYLPAIRAHIEAGKPFFGICVGLQALFAGSEEAPHVSGLNLIPSSLKKFQPTDAEGKRKAVPCIGWNDAILNERQNAVRIPDKTYYGLSPTSKYYYVHSYFAPYVPGVLESQGWTVAVASYGGEEYIGAIGRDNVFATQFHPEKSGAAGLRVIQAFLDGAMWTDPVPPPILTTMPHDLTLSTLSKNNGLTHRVIACLDVRTNDSGDLVVTKGDQYDVREKTSSKGVRNMGKPVDMARKYYLQGADEVTFLNITSFRDCPVQDLPMLEILRLTSESVFVPLTIGGGIRDTVDPVTKQQYSALDIAKLYFSSGADKVSIGSDAVLAAEEYYANDSQLTGKTGIEAISAAYGRQAVVVSVDPKRVFVEDPTSTSHQTIKTNHPDPVTGHAYVYYACTIRGGRETRDLDVVQLVRAVEAMGAGEILLNSIDRDGQNQGYDLELIRWVKREVQIPVIASSGAGRPSHFAEVFKMTAVDAALGAGMFHRGEYTVSQVKDHLITEGLSVRPFEES
ncbi:imidazoleglycerol phosphate synthase, cyclase subunit, variant [Exophiala mesophila]|uniref:Imidazole glycerol phosphate synthase hisHF n=1 Tax=Exophiala mesophila TaxID=212818 RepID=A0A0D1Z9B3_EXOME|nr:imidazoleglycerol phosphate synthase, cyclase subunit [Exophiala mesophila]XP_016222183.1 imidazoleglycerol phosphate synthase, cyclase subunit, variant [Exophiala mesophila]KIV90608.1 imidazoleglycerol phosphate synthase, cyclase subunit [Exophiala mesophila]KIV90609.1 imidazoleglycerol phosphate synthase, cyclase subunit, variant [Exophiala mesophila]